MTLSSPASQQDGHGNNRSVHNGDSTDAKDEAIAALKSALAAKDALLAIKDEAIAAKDVLISQLQAQLGAA